MRHTNKYDLKNNKFTNNTVQQKMYPSAIKLQV